MRANNAQGGNVFSYINKTFPIVYFAFKSMPRFDHIIEVKGMLNCLNKFRRFWFLLGVGQAHQRSVMRNSRAPIGWVGPTAPRP